MAFTPSESGASSGSGSGTLSAGAGNADVIRQAANPPNREWKFTIVVACKEEAAALWFETINPLDTTKYVRTQKIAETTALTNGNTGSDVDTTYDNWLAADVSVPPGSRLTLVNTSVSANAYVVSIRPWQG